MSFDAHKNLAYSLVATAPSPASSGTSLVVTSGQGARFPATPFNATVWATGQIPVPTNAEIVRVTSVVGDTLTIVRAQESTSARAIIIGDQIAATITAKTLTDVETALTPLLSNIKISAGGSSDLRSDLTFSNSNGVSFGLNVGTITASVAAQSNQSAIKAFGASNTGNTAGNTGLSTGVDWVLAGSNQATVSESTTPGGPNTLWVNVTTAAQTVESQSVGMSNLGNTAGTSGVASGGQVRALIVGGNNITIFQSVNGASATLTVSAFNQSNQSAIKGLGVSNTGNTAGNTGLSSGIDWVIAGSNGVTASESTVGGGPNTIWISGATQTNQSAIKGLGASNTGNTAGNTGLSTGIDWVFAGSNNVTVSESTVGGGPNTLWISGPNVGGGQALTVQDSATTLAATRMVFSNTNGVSFGLSTAASIVTVTASVSQSNQSAIKGLGASNTGNTAGNTGLSTGIDWVLAGSNNITISESTVGGGPNTLWVSGANAGGAQTGISGIVASNTTYTSGTVVFTGSNMITVKSSGAGQTVILDATQSNQSAVKGLGVSNTGNTAGNTGLSTGIDWVIAGSNGITASQSTAGGGPNTIWISGATQTVESQSIGMSNLGNTSGTTGVASGGQVRAVIVGGNNVTVSQSVNGASATLTISAFNQSTQSAIKGLGVSNTGNTAGNTGLSTGIDWVIAGSNGVTASQSTAAGGPNTVWISGVTTAAQTNQSAIKALGASNTGNTAGNTGVSTGIDWVVAGTNNVTISESTVGGGPNTLWVSGPNLGGGAALTVQDSATTLAATKMVFSNANGVSFGLSTAASIVTVTASAAGGGVGVGITNSGNTAGTSGTVTAGNYYIVGSGAITMSQSSSGSNATLTVTVPNSSSLVGTYGVGLSTNGSTISVSMPYLPMFEPYPLLNALSTTYAPVAGSWYFMPVYVEQPLSGGRINVMVAHGSTASILRESSVSFQTGSLGTVSYNFSLQRIAALYSLGAGTNSTRLESTWSNDHSLSIGFSVKVTSGGATTMTASVGATMTYICSIDASGNRTTTTVGHSSTTSSGSSNINTTVVTSILSSERNMLSSQLMVPIAFNTSIAPGQYWVGFMWTTGQTTATTGGVATTGPVVSVVNQYAIFGNTNTAARIFGQTVATSGSQVWPGHGVWTAASAAPPATVAFSDIRTQASQPIPYMNWVNSTI